ncbi:hypothetical protein [Mycobacterium angelicum]|nr:hypothetical protein [Mycobacterium angelicum]
MPAQPASAAVKVETTEPKLSPAETTAEPAPSSAAGSTANGAIGS